MFWFTFAFGSLKTCDAITVLVKYLAAIRQLLFWTGRKHEFLCVTLTEFIVRIIKDIHAIYKIKTTTLIYTP